MVNANHLPFYFWRRDLISISQEAEGGSERMRKT
jgi:hypothetical protein